MTHRPIKYRLLLQPKHKATSGINHRQKGDTMKANTTTKATTQATDTKATFTTLMLEYIRQANPSTRTNEKDYTKALTDLATAVAYSVLKKCIETSQNQALIQVKRDIARDTALLNNIKYAQDNAYEYRYNKDGERVLVIKDKDLHTALDKMCAETMGEGIDLVHEAIISLMTEYEKATQRTLYTLYDQNDKEIYSGYERPQNIPESITKSTYLDNDYYIEIMTMNNHIQWLETPYTIRQLKRKVWIKVEDSKNGWETTTTTPIQQVYKAVRRAIEQSRAVQTDARNGYTYLEDLARDEETDTEQVIYRRLPKYADLGGNVTDFNGKETAYTADTQTVQDMDTLIEKLNLSKKQAEILKLRLSGYGTGAISTYLGISRGSVWNTLARLQDKCKAIGLVPQTK